MEVHPYVWAVTIVGFLVLLAIDLFLVDRKPHAVGVGEAARWVLFYLSLAILFGIGLGMVTGGQHAKEFFAGYITEYSLSVDNLFVFVVIMASFAVPTIHQHRVLLFGIMTALVLRGAFIAAGSAAISRFNWVFYIFGAFLIYTAIQLARTKGEPAEENYENAAMRLVRRILPVTDSYHGANVIVKVDGKRFVTPMLIVMLTIGTADVMFALDSIPAIFGLTKEPFLVFTANAFALMGLRQLFFLVGGLLDRLVYLSVGLSVILGFIGVKLIFEALHGNHVEWAPEIGIEMSLGVIVGVLGVTTVASLVKVRRDPSVIKQPAAAGAVPRSAGDPEDERSGAS